MNLTMFMEFKSLKFTQKQVEAGLKQTSCSDVLPLIDGRSITTDTVHSK